MKFKVGDEVRIDKFAYDFPPGGMKGIIRKVDCFEYEGPALYAIEFDSHFPGAHDCSNSSDPDFCIESGYGWWAPAEELKLVKRKIMIFRRPDGNNDG